MLSLFIMSEQIHENLEAARIACRNYSDGLFYLQKKFGVAEECEDSCAEVYIWAKYKTESGEVKKYYHG